MLALLLYLNGRWRITLINIYELARKEAGIDMPERVANIDGDIICYSIAFACKDESKRFCLATVKSFLRNTVEAVAADDYRIFLTGNNNFRIKIAKSRPYKGNRKAPKPEYWQLIRDYLVEEHGAEICDDIEADDALGLAQTDNTILCTIDKDLDMIAGQHYNFNKKKLYTVSQEDADLFFFTQWLTGDSVDNIPGAKGIGPAKAKKIIRKSMNKLMMAFAVEAAYLNAGHDLDYIEEQGHLIWMQRASALTFEDFLDD